MSHRVTSLLSSLLRLGRPEAPGAEPPQGPTNVAGQGPPAFGTAERPPVALTRVQHPDGRMSSYPPPEHWDDWVEWDAKAWPERVPRRYTLVPTVCFNCESACGLLAYVDRTSFEIKKFEGNPVHPGSRGRNCAKGPATHNQVYDPERILHPLKRVGERGAGQWKRISWDEALSQIAEKMRQSRARRRDGIVYHVGRPGEDGYTERVLAAWGVDGHNSHTNICSSSARTGYYLWSGFDRPSPDHARARVILLISSHLETGHYFNPHAQRIIEGKLAGAKLLVLDPRLSNTASRADLWLPTWPGSEPFVLLAIARHLLRRGLYDREFVRRWVNWAELLEAGEAAIETPAALAVLRQAREADPEGYTRDFTVFERLLVALYDEFTFERAAAEAQVPAEHIERAAEIVAGAGDRLAAHVWRAAATGNLGGWQVARCLFFLNVLTGSVGTEGGTSGNTWNKFVPPPFKTPPPVPVWNELHLPDEWPLAHFEMSFLLPHFLLEGRGSLDVYFTRVYNPMWTNPDGFVWLEALRDEQKIGCHVALTPTWSETAWLADYVLPMGHGGERHDLMSQETHAGQWIAFRQPVRRVALERAGQPSRFTYETNPGEVWEENEWWIQLSAHLDPDGALGVRQWFESPYRAGEIITIDEYYRWIFENSVPGLPEAARAEGLTPLGYLRRSGCFEIERANYTPYDAPAPGATHQDEAGRALDADGKPVGVMLGEEARRGFETPSRRLELYSPTMRDWGWSGQAYTLPWALPSHVHPSVVDRAAGEMVLVPTFRLPTLIHTRSANAKWLVEISHKNPLWMHPEDAGRLGLRTGDLARVETEIGRFVDRVWVTEGIRPGIVAMSHHLGRWRLDEKTGVSRGASSLVRLTESGRGQHGLSVVHGARAWESCDPDTSRVWWEDVGVHQNLTHAVHPDPVSGGHCWHQKVLVRPAQLGDSHGDVRVDTRRSMQVYRHWLGMTRPASSHSPDGTRRPRWLKRPLKPAPESYRLPPREGASG
jgi:anaerobic selenocysteine-containing dehydrogenase